MLKTFLELPNIILQLSLHLIHLPHQLLRLLNALLLVEVNFLANFVDLFDHGLMFAIDLAL